MRVKKAQTNGPSSTFTGVWVMPVYNVVMDPPHADQERAWASRSRYTVLRCGRRWGKTQLAVRLAIQSAADGWPVGIFAPDYKILSETYHEIEQPMLPIVKHSNKTEGVIRLITGGRIDFWTLNNPHAGRSRKYKVAIIDEAAFAGPQMGDIWDKAIAPTLLDLKGDAWALSTPAGVNSDNWFYRICSDKTLGWTEFHAPAVNNPMLDPDEIERLRERNPPLVFAQEYLGEFVDWSGVAFFAEPNLLEDGRPVEQDTRVDVIYAVIDTALKEGKEHDATAVVYFARNKVLGHPLLILDWDILQIESNLLADWLPQVHRRLDELSEQYKPRYGWTGPYIEDKASGITLLQHAAKVGLRAEALPSGLTAQGKDGRALSVSGYVYQGQVKLTRQAFDKVTQHKGMTRNHLLSQVCGYRVGEKNAHQMDLLDCFCYGVSIGLGNSDGY